MIRHTDLGNATYTRAKKLKQLLDSGRVHMAGNSKLRIYGTLECSSGKRMKPEHRVFFRDSREAMQSGYRPCGHCLRQAYRRWKDAQDAGSARLRHK